MIQVLVKKQDENVTGFHIEGHSGYDDRGKDIVCAAVSALAINCVNSIEEFTADDFSVGSDEVTGMLDFELSSKPSKEAELFLYSLILGLEGISETYGNQYISVINR